ncbi:hypothetical protein ACKEIK_002957 [Klebsiella pneumoniae]|uniref:hypothetical protein n=1 Tax=Klebsiella pneumoniae TaxID=573 RepID=UPI00050C8884|nr:hypothetical protein [Klebsiella pneumoniae]KAB7552997.1 hypothetical protein GBN87_03625 [Klebsiella pneumoniae]MCD9783451.1 hypothetical protein [Klebsiella pneumoniae]MCE0315193.1 hypothetical protein [Klebsiella pneumoniae]MCS6633723.1 hypothetical protein [Klebsiella pneumoniae subsp. pneumoniae]MCS6664591.1 hypothetical protein [Klebsiella pneumoniae subsp. pneumoniae]
MNLHDRLRIVLAPARQFWRAFSYLMQVHENHYTKRAGVAGIRARAQRLRLGPKFLQEKKLTFIFQ